MKESYKRSRQDDDLNQPLSVQPWGRDGDKRRFWLIEGQDDTHFRLYRESNPALRHVTWRSVAGTIDEVKEVAGNLGEDNSLLSRRLKDRILAAVPRFEASEDVCSPISKFDILSSGMLILPQKRRRRDYRLARKAQFTRPEPGFSLYEGRTRGKRTKYTYSDEEDGGSDTLSTRRSNRQSGISTPAEPSGPTFTASGRRVRSRHGGAYGEIISSGQADTSRQASIVGMDGPDEDDDEPVSSSRPRRTAQQNGNKAPIHSRKHIDGYNALDSMEDESEASSSGGEWDGGDDDEPDDMVEDEEDGDVDMSDNEAEVSEDEEEEDVTQSLVVSLRYLKGRSSPPTAAAPNAVNLSPNRHGPPTAPTTVEVASEASRPAAHAAEQPESLLHTSVLTIPPSTPASSVSHHSRQPSIPANPPTYSFEQSRAYNKPLIDAASTQPHMLISNPDEREEVSVPNHTVHPRPELNGRVIHDQSRASTATGGLEEYPK